MDIMTRYWMFFQYLEDQNEKAELAKQHGYLIGSFVNPQAAQKLANTKTIETNDEDAERLIQKIEKENLERERKHQESQPRRRRRQIINE